MAPAPSLRRRPWRALVWRGWWVVAVLLGSGCALEPAARGRPGADLRTSTGLPYRAPRALPPWSAGAPAGGPVVPPAPLGPQPAARWRQAAARWMGTPYVLGGTTRNGVDCSAFAQHLHREVVGLHLPRTTRDQWDAGRPVPATALQAGDLVFFMTLGTGQASHVGVFLEGQEFVHAGTRTGVTTASFREAYWRERFVGARRFAGVAGPGAGPRPGPGGVRR